MYNCQLHCSWELGIEALRQEDQKDNPKMDAMALEAILLEFMSQPWRKGGFV